MKFRLLKALPPSGNVDASWIKYHQDALSRDPKGLRSDYELLVRAIVDLTHIEEALRKEVLHEDGESNWLTSFISNWGITDLVSALFPSARGGVEVFKLIQELSKKNYSELSDERRTKILESIGPLIASFKKK